MNLKNYWKTYQNIWFFILICTVLCRGIMMLNPSIGIDTEVMIALQNVFYDSWLGIGRYGLVLLKNITDTLTFNPYLTGIAVLMLLPLSCFLWTWLFQKVTQKTTKTGVLMFSIILIASTILTEQLYFKLQAMEVCIGFCLMPVSLFLIFEVTQGTLTKAKMIRNLAVSLGLNLILFSLYQVMVPLFIAGAAIVFYLYVYVRAEQKTRAFLWKMIGWYSAVFLVSFVCNQLIATLFFSHGSDYLSEQILWGTTQAGVCVSNIFQHIKEIVFGTQIYYAKTYSVYVCILLACTIFTIIKNPRKKGNVLGLLSLLLIVTAPFYMTILCGKAPVIRSQLVMPFVLAFMAYVVFNMGQEKKIYYYFVLVVGIFTAFLQVKYTSMLQYSDTVRYESDVRIASQLMQEIDALQDAENSVPVVFYGAHPAELNHACIRGDVIGYSFFEWDTEVTPTGYFSTRRILAFMHTLGKNYQQADEEQTKEAARYVVDLPSWPQQGSVIRKNDLILVKLGEITYP